MCLSSVAHKKFNDSFHHPARIWLARVHSWGDENAFLVPTFLTHRILFFWCDGDILAPIASKSPTQSASIYEVLGKAIALYPSQIVTQVWVGVWETVGKVDCIIGLSECMSECQRVVASIKSVAFPFEAVLVVSDVSADSMPAEFPRAISWELREAQYTHTVVVEGVRLRQVQNVKLNRHVTPSVSDTKEEPLSMPVCIDVILQNEIVLIITNLHSW